VTPRTADGFVQQHSKDLAQIESLREQLAAANGRAARAEHKVTALIEECARLRSRLPRGKR
jgi:hypothetical protein